MKKEDTSNKKPTCTIYSTEEFNGKPVFKFYGSKLDQLETFIGKYKDTYEERYMVTNGMKDYCVEKWKLVLDNWTLFCISLVNDKKVSVSKIIRELVKFGTIVPDAYWHDLELIKNNENVKDYNCFIYISGHKKLKNELIPTYVKLYIRDLYNEGLLPYYKEEEEIARQDMERYPKLDFDFDQY